MAAQRRRRAPEESRVLRIGGGGGESEEQRAEDDEECSGSRIATWRKATQRAGAFEWKAKAGSFMLRSSEITDQP
uniref:Uncharacterized protein n=1 Tax=Oryza meridionalis TaxID=40149 RepID=A0A0E0D441_9ORYZ